MRAAANLGMVYLDGVAVAQDLDQALYWTEQAANAGDPVAQNNLGHMYENGLGVEADPDQALNYYRMAAEQRHKLAEDNLDRLEEKLAASTPEPRRRDDGEAVTDTGGAEGLTPKAPRTASKISNAL
jgi:TPR repeat protein